MVAVLQKTMSDDSPHSVILQQQARIKALENELAEMTVALAQAWDQLVPFLQDSPQADRELDVMPVLESIMAAVDASVGAVYLAEREQQRGEWFMTPPDPAATRALAKHLDPLPTRSEPLYMRGIPSQLGPNTHWLFMPILVNMRAVGAIGVGVNEASRSFTAYDAQVVARLTERAASRIAAADLAATQEREAELNRDLRIASQIQHSIQPLSVPQVAGLEIAADWQPAASVGGDAWGWVMQPSGRFGCFLLDVAGKGLPAALTAVSLHTALKMALRLDLTPVEVLQTINNEFFETYTQANIMATVSVLTIDPVSGEVVQANAGHPPTLVHQDGAWKRWKASMPPLGVLEDISPREIQTGCLRPGDSLICYSDGFSEIETSEGFWGEQGIIAALGPTSQSASQIACAVLRGADAARQGRLPHDDQTLLIIRYTNSPTVIAT